MRILTGAMACVLILVSAARADEGAIAALLERVEIAVLAGDGEAYLRCVDRGVAPEWEREQANWAADLAQHVPEEFAIELRTPPGEAEAGAFALLDSVTAEAVSRADVRVSWRMPGGAERSVEIPGAFVLRAGEWRYAGEAWTRVASDDGRNVVLFLEEGLRPVAERIIELMPGIRAHVDEGFETRLEHPQVIKLYDDMRHLQQSIYLSYTDPLGGWNEPGESIKVLADEGMGSSRLRTLLAHEYGHVATFTYGPDASDNLPWWAAEGVAELAAERYAGAAAREGVEQMVRSWAASGALADWEEMRDFRQTPAELHGHVYIQSHQFVGYLSERFGRAARNRWIRLLVRGATEDDAAREAFGIGFAELDGEWRASLQAGPSPTDDP